MGIRFCLRLCCIGFLCLSWGLNLGYAEENPKPIFKLVKGQGVEVCEAYLKRLNETEFLDNDPLNSRVSEPLLDGFINLKSTPLTNEETQRLYYKIYSFDGYKNQDAYEQQNKNELSIKQFKKQQQDLVGIVEGYMSRHTKDPFIRYLTPLDMDNDGIADDTAIKNRNSVYIVDNSLNRINEERMKNIFSDQQILDWVNIKLFPPLAYPITVFNYKDQYYFDGFINLGMSDTSPSITLIYLKNEPMLLGVFIHKKHRTHKICEYQWINSPSIDYIRSFNGWVFE